MANAKRQKQKEIGSIAKIIVDRYIAKGIDRSSLLCEDPFANDLMDSLSLTRL